MDFCSKVDDTMHVIGICSNLKKKYLQSRHISLVLFRKNQKIMEMVLKKIITLEPISQVLMSINYFYVDCKLIIPKKKIINHILIFTFRSCDSKPGNKPSTKFLIKNSFFSSLFSLIFGLSLFLT
jgi:hypothetical protein